jgi:RHS repeat-associated protein
MNCGGALTTQTWSPENKLASVVSPTESESYLCSADGLRKSQTTATGTTLFTYDEVLVLLETDTSGNLQARNTDHPENFGGLVSQNRSGVSSWYGYDGQGSTRILVSIGGSITDSYSYKVFGEPLQTGSGTVNPHTYVGRLRYRRQTNGFYLLSVRVLDPFTGRFISVDPIGFVAGDPSFYRYVENCPVNVFDAMGLRTQIGHVPPSVTGCGGAGDVAVTGCNVDPNAQYIGSVWTLICDDTCAVACFDAHEGQHRHDVAACCARYPICLKHQSAEVCSGLFQDWKTKNQRWRECRGYHVELTCTAKMIAQRNCWHCKPDNACCFALKRIWTDDHSTNVPGWCRGIQPWGPPPAPTCPF